MHGMEDNNSFSLPKKRNISQAIFNILNITSKENFEPQLLRPRLIKVWHYQVGTTPTCRKKLNSFFAVMKIEVKRSPIVELPIMKRNAR